MRRVLVILLLLVLTLPLWAVDWEGHASSVGMVYVPPGQQQLAADIIRTAEVEKARLVPLLGISTPRWFPIYAYTDRVAFFRDTGRNLDLLGESELTTGLIRIDATGVQGSVRGVLAHEMVHSLLISRLGPNIGALPIWVNEGIATLYADHISPQELSGIAQTQPRNGPLTIEQLTIAFSNGVSRDAAYQQSRAMVAWLEFRHPGALNEIFEQMNAGRGFESALYRVLEITPDDWLQQWQEGIPRYLIWTNTALNIIGSPIFFAPLSILLAIIAIIKLIRKKREDEEEDIEEDDNGDSAAPPALLHPDHESIDHVALARYPIWDDIRSVD